MLNLPFVKFLNWLFGLETYSFSFAVQDCQIYVLYANLI